MKEGGGQNQTKQARQMFGLTGAPGQDNSNLSGFIVCLTYIVFMQLCVLYTLAVSVTAASPHSAPWVLSPVVWTRCSGCVQRALDDWWCSHTYTGASASRSHTPDLENTQTQTHTQRLGVITHLWKQAQEQLPWRDSYNHSARLTERLSFTPASS